MLISTSYLQWVQLDSWYFGQLGYCLLCCVLVMLSNIGYEQKVRRFTKSTESLSPFIRLCIEIVANIIQRFIRIDKLSNSDLLG